MSKLGNDSDALGVLDCGMTSLYTLLQRGRALNIEPPFRLVLSKRRWLLGEVLDWADEVSRAWQAYESDAASTRSAGATEQAGSGSAHVRRSGRLRRSSSKSRRRTRSGETGRLTFLPPDLQTS